jgi:hypothetical protein
MSNEWYLTDVPKVVAETDLLYSRIVEKAPEKTKSAVTIQRIIEVRHWESSLDLYKERFEATVAQLGCFYIPNRIVPGPAFVFPMRSADGTYPRAQTKPLEGSALVINNETRYRYIGEKEKYLGPNWLGNDSETLRLIIQKQMVLCVEGPFDLLAIRLACPRYPILSPLTKHLGKDHVAYLRILGVKQILLMYDNEAGGEEAMQQQARQIKSMEVIPCECPKKDPSKALERREWAVQLSSRVSKFFGY